MCHRILCWIWFCKITLNESKFVFTLGQILPQTQDELRAHFQLLGFLPANQWRDEDSILKSMI